MTESQHFSMSQHFSKLKFLDGHSYLKVKTLGSSPVPTICATTKTMAFGCVHLVPFTNERHDGHSAIGRSKNLEGEGQAVTEGHFGSVEEF